MVSYSDGEGTSNFTNMYLEMITEFKEVITTIDHESVRIFSYILYPFKLEVRVEKRREIQSKKLSRKF